MPGRSVAVVPCFNEESRLDFDRFAELVEGGTRVLFVDDGSTDETRALIAKAVITEPGFSQLDLDRNVGKAEAVRAGMRRALDDNPRAVGYLDADLAAPPPEFLRLAAALDGDLALDVAIGSRVALMGRNIDRRPARHFAGRVFATAASFIIRAPIYDTQCGAKLFRADDRLRVALQAPFSSRWAFDVELLGRLLADPTPVRMREIPLENWRDVSGSKLNWRARLGAGLDLARLAVRARRKR